MVAHGASCSISQDYLECVKMWDGSLANYLLSILVCPLSENLLKFLLTAASGFSDTTRILLRGRNTMTKMNSNLPPWWGNSSPHCFCYCQQPVDNTLAYIVVVANFFQPVQLKKVNCCPMMAGATLSGLFGLWRWVVCYQSLSLFFWAISMPYFCHPMHQNPRLIMAW